jgi:hypothetical protein
MADKTPEHVRLTTPRRLRFVVAFDVESDRVAQQAERCTRRTGALNDFHLRRNPGFRAGVEMAVQQYRLSLSNYSQGGSEIVHHLQALVYAQRRGI